MIGYCGVSFYTFCMQKILVSQCLLGAPVRYDGKSKGLDDHFIQRWQSEQRLITVCPELSGGLLVPREAAEIVEGDGDAVLSGNAQILTGSGANVTTAFIDGAFVALKLCQEHDIRYALLSAKSPSCGNQQIYNGQFNRQLIEGKGVTAALLEQHGIRVFNQFEINDLAQVLQESSDI